MVVLKDIKITAKTDISSDLLVLGFFKKTNINTMIKYLSSNDQDKVLKAFTLLKSVPMGMKRKVSAFPINWQSLGCRP